MAGKDGYDVFAECPVLVDEEQGPRLPNVVRNHFTLLSAVNGFRTPGSSAEKAVARFKAAIGKVRRDATPSFSYARPRTLTGAAVLLFCFDCSRRTCTGSGWRRKAAFVWWARRRAGSALLHQRIPRPGVLVNALSLL